MTAVYTLDVRTLGNEMWDAAFRLLPTERLEKATALWSKNAQKQSMGAGLLLRYTLLQAEIAPVSLEYDSSGKPTLPKNNISVSLSHSGSWAACVLSDRATGIDVQDMTEGDQTLLLKYFHRDEREFVRQGGTARFYQIWCRKECYIKAFGWRNLPEINTLTAPDGYGYFDFQPENIMMGCVLSRTQPDIWIVKQDELLHGG